MICHDFRVCETHTIRVDGKPQEITLTAGSDSSAEDASRKAAELARVIESHIRNRSQKRRDKYDDAIREHAARGRVSATSSPSTLAFSVTFWFKKRSVFARANNNSSTSAQETRS